MRRRPVELVVDYAACDGHGVCAELFPEWVGLDPWGYPIVREGAVPVELLEHARRAVRECPRMAVMLLESSR